MSEEEKLSNSSVIFIAEHADYKVHSYILL